MKTKKQWRSELALISRGLSSKEITKQSRVIARLLAQWPVYRSANGILFYAPLANEVQIQKLMKKALAKGKVVSLPACDRRGNSMKPLVFNSMEDLAKGRFGILQPKSTRACEADTADIDLMLVPGLAFDKHGRRLGRGKGFYDTFLRKWAGKAVKIGLALDHQMLAKVPTTARDISMDFVVCSRGILRCPGSGA